MQRQVGDLDGDGLPDALWIGLQQGDNGATNRLVGVSTASGARIGVPIVSASPIPLRALAVDAQQNGETQILVSDGRGAQLFVFAQCELRTVVDSRSGKPFVFDLQNLRDSGTGVGCSDLGDGRRLVALQALDNGGQWTVHRTEINLDGTRATTGRSDTLAAASTADPEVTSAQTIRLRQPHHRPGWSSTALTANPFDPGIWRTVDGFDDLTDVTYHHHVNDATVRVAFDRPEVRNAFRPHTVDELYRVLDHARMSPDVGVVLLTGNGPSPKDGGWAFCSGGDQRIRGRSGYQYASGETADTVDAARAGRLHILEVQRLIRFMPKVVICLVNGWAAGGGHSLHVVCDLTLASREHARFKQTDADVGSFDGGYGSAYLARQVGQKFAREIFFLGRPYTAEQMHRMGAVNEVVDHAELEAVGAQWAAEINAKSPQAQRMLKFAFNLLDDGLVGQQSVRRGSHPAGVHDRRGRRGQRCLPAEAPTRLEPVSAVLLITSERRTYGSGSFSGLGSGFSGRSGWCMQLVRGWPWSRWSGGSIR